MTSKKKNTVINLFQVKMMVRISDPNKPQLFELKHENLVPDKTNILKNMNAANYPFITDTVLYPQFIQNYNYNRILKFFFNKNRFMDVLQEELKKQNQIDSNDTGVDRDLERNPQFIKKSNFKTMLQLLFPTAFPFINNITQSIDEVIDPDMENIKLFTTKGSNFGKILSKKFSKRFSYLNVDNKTYTITRTIWLNDVMNHYLYNELLNTYYVFDDWRENKWKTESDPTQLLNDIINYVKDSLEKKWDKNDGELFVRMYQDNDQDAPYKSRIKDNDATQILNFDKQIDILLNTYKLVVNPNNQFNPDITDTKTRIKIKEAIEKLVKFYKNIKTPVISNDLERFLQEFDDKSKLYNDKNQLGNYITNLKYNYLTDPKLSEIKTKIESKYPQFNNFMLAIRKFKNKTIENPKWDKNIKDIINANNSQDAFKQNIFDPIKECYGSIENISVAGLSEKQTQGGMQQTQGGMQQTQYKYNQNGGNKCDSTNRDIIYVGFDTSESSSSGSSVAVPIIDAYLQIDVIEGEINADNLKLIKCVYQNEDLGNRFKQLWYHTNPTTWKVSSEMVFFSAKEILDKYASDNKPKIENDQNKTKKKNGGKRTHRTTRRN